MNPMNWPVVFPELVLLVAACAITLIDLWVTDPQRRQDPAGVTERTVGKHGLALRQGGQRFTEGRVGGQPGVDVYIVNVKQVVLGIDAVVADQPLQGYAVQSPVFAAQAIYLWCRDADDLGHVAVDPHVDEIEQLSLSGIESIVKIENQNVHHCSRTISNSLVIPQAPQ